MGEGEGSEGVNKHLGVIDSVIIHIPLQDIFTLLQNLTPIHLSLDYQGSASQQHLRSYQHWHKIEPIHLSNANLSLYIYHINVYICVYKYYHLCLYAFISHMYVVVSVLWCFTPTITSPRRPALSCDSAHSWPLYSSLGDQAIHKYNTISH